MTSRTLTHRAHRLAWVTLVYTVAVVLWGAYVRATGSGAGCGSHWPTCHGQVVPRDPTVETLVELTHRVTSGLAWILAFVLAAVAWRAFPRGHRARWAAVAGAVFMTTEALIGAGVVLLEMVADNASTARAGWMAAHLINTFLLIAALTLAVRASAPERPHRLTAPWPALHLVALAAILATGMSGAVAALGDTLFPAETLGEAIRQDLSSAAHLFVRLRVLHPFIALGTAALLVYLGGQQLSVPHGQVRATATWLVGLTAVQVVLGFVNVLLLAPVWMQVVHLLFAHLVWIALIAHVDASRLVSTPGARTAPRPATPAPGPGARPGASPGPAPVAGRAAPR